MSHFPQIERHTSDIRSLMAETGKRIEVTARTGDLYELPAWGFLEAVEVVFTPPVPNMNVASPHRLIVEWLSDAPQGVQVFAVVRNVKDMER